MTREEIRDLVIKGIVSAEELTNVVDTLFNAIGSAYGKGYNQGKYDPDFDNDED